MAEIGNGTGTGYPTAIDTNTSIEVNSPNAGKTLARAEVVNDLASALIAVQTELGTSPKGTAADVKTFLQVEHGLDGTHGAVTATSVTTDDLIIKSPWGDVTHPDYGAVGNGSTSDKTALDLAFANTVIFIPEGTFMAYDLSLSGVNKLFGLGQGSIIKCNNLAANYVIGFQSSGQSTLVIDDLVVDGNKALGTYTGSGHGLDLRGYDEVYIGRLEVKNTWGHGAQFADCAKVRIGTLVVHDCNKYGVVFDSNGGSGLAEEITIDTLIAYSNGTADTGYSGINFSDLTSTPTGSRRVSIGKVYAFSNGRDGIAFGRNAVDGPVGASQITVGEIHTYSNLNHGVEFYGCRNVIVGSIYAHDNTYTGVAIYKGDSSGTYALPRDICIGNIISHNNGYDGVDIMGAHKLQINSIIAYNNSIGNANTYNGVKLDANNPLSDSDYNSDIHIGSILAYDDQGSPTQKNGFVREDVVNGGHISIGYIRAYGNATTDIIDGMSDTNYIDPITIDSWDVETISPSYAGNIDGAGVRHSPFKVGGLYYGAGQTTDATARSLVRVPIPASKVCSVEVYAQGATNSTLTNRGTYHLSGTVIHDGAAVSVLGTTTVVHFVETNAGLDATLIGPGAGADYFVVQVTGLAATTINWKAMVRVTEH